MPISEARRQGLLNLIAKNPEKREYILSRSGASEEDIQGTQPPKSTLSRVRSAIDTETDAMAEGVASGATWGMMDVPKNSDPFTVNLPFFGETSPSRTAGTILGAALSPLALPVAGATGALASKAAPVVGEIGAKALGSAGIGAGLETIRQVAFDDEIDPAKIGTAAAMFLAGDMVAEYAPSIANQLLAWKAKIPKEKLALVERFKELPEVQAEATNLKQTSPFFNPEYQAILKEKKLAQDRELGLKPLGEDRMLPAPPVPPTRIQETPETALAGTRATIDKTINPTTPSLPERTSASASRGMGESPSQIAFFEKQAAEKTEQAIASKAMAEKQAFNRKVDLDYYKKDVEFIKKIEEAFRKGESVDPVILAEYKRTLSRVKMPQQDWGMPVPETPKKFPTEGVEVEIPKTGSFDTSGRSQRLGGLPGTGQQNKFPTEDIQINLSAVGGKSTKAKKPVNSKPKSKKK